ncbi:glycosyltransferase family 4 protein [Streptacidiphilus rugosus]|uniref:glycosyltransferase family 4 protein n=1 Tax=Streptacidiphilus rugosus TaxID=405783 RepID=UPI0018DB16DD|nr:glycosyltransferase family 4 protein [Streptacidiphilus rugosus]
MRETQANRSRPRVTLVVPVLSEFRRPFFARLRADLDAAGIETVVAHGHPWTQDLSARADTVPVTGAVALRQRSLRICGRSLVHKELGPLAHSSDVLIVDQALRNLELYPQLVRQRLGRGPAIAMWDHGRTYCKAQSAVEQAAKFALTRRARWFFAYTEGGARSVVEQGFPAERTTVVQNAVDTTALRAARAAVTREQLRAFRLRHGLTPGRTALFVGALSRDKRIPELLEAAEEAARLLPGFRLLIAGRGEQEDLVHRAASRSEAVVPLGRVVGPDKGILGAASELMLMPGLVGLCAVDSFALGTPLVTTDFPHHAPEFEYLRHGVNAWIAPGDPAGYAREVVALLGDSARLDTLRRHCREDALRYTVEEMSRRFAEGTVRLLREMRR